MSKTKPRIPRLGRGLSSLLSGPVHIEPVPVQPVVSVEKGNSQNQTPNATTPSPQITQENQPGQTPKKVDSPSEGLFYVEMHHIEPNPHQPRQNFDQAGLQRLAESIQTAGLMQPIIIRPKPPEGSTWNTADLPVEALGRSDGLRYQLIAGERRWRAAQLAGLQTIPAIVRQLDDHLVAEWALIENLQREDLDPIERAVAFKYLLEQFNLSHDQVAQRVGVDRSTISNSLRILDLHKDVQALIRSGRLSGGQAKALAGVSDHQQQLFLAKKAVAQGWSVRQLEAAVRQLAGTGPQSVPIAPAVRRAAHLTDLEQQIGQQLGTKVRLRAGRRKGSGTLSIDFYSLDQFDSLLARLGVQTE